MLSRMAELKDTLVSYREIITTGVQ